MAYKKLDFSKEPFVPKMKDYLASIGKYDKLTNNQKEYRIVTKEPLTDKEAAVIVAMDEKFTTCKNVNAKKKHVYGVYIPITEIRVKKFRYR